MVAVSLQTLCLTPPGVTINCSEEVLFRPKRIELDRDSVEIRRNVELMAHPEAEKYWPLQFGESMFSKEVAVVVKTNGQPFSG